MKKFSVQIYCDEEERKKVERFINENGIESDEEWSFVDEETLYEETIPFSPENDPTDPRFKKE